MKHQQCQLVLSFDSFNKSVKSAFDVSLKMVLLTSFRPSITNVFAPESRKRFNVACSSSGSSGTTRQQQQDRRRVLTEITAAGLLIGLQGASPSPALAELKPETTVAQAVAGGFVGWWKSRRSANGGAKLLAPLYVAQQRLQQASDLLQDDAVDGAKVLEALQLVRSSSLNCYLFEALPDDTLETKASLLTQQYELSDPCTFRIVLRNVTDLEPAETQQAAKQKMDALVLSYQKLDEYLDMAREAGNNDVIPKARDQLKATQLIAADIESFVKTTLGV